MGTTAKRLFCMAAVLCLMVTPGGVCASGNADLKAVVDNLQSGPDTGQGYRRNAAWPN
jgi:hypothetical protein